MIFDGIDAIGRYRGMYVGLDALIEWLEGHDVAELADGTTEICGKQLFANVMRPATRAAAEAHYELHHNYMDVQMDLEGAEAFRTCSGEANVVQPYDAQDDFALVEPKDPTKTIECVLGPGRFVLFGLGEPHMPTLDVAGTHAAPVRKVCFKIAADMLWNKTDIDPENL